MKHVYLFLYQTLSMYYVPGTELAPAGYIYGKNSTCLQGAHDLSETQHLILHETYNTCMKNAMIKDTENPEEHLRLCIWGTHQLSIYCSSVPNPLFNDCSVIDNMITEIWGTTDIFTTLIILIYKHCTFLFIEILYFISIL